ncbi:MAG: sigma-54-dependent Fis family transcriptional regulator [Oligoflexia bacterium]|nr:MAG: sigma-54-dependent Fis family transcriptional regulator [Oligoflexia bacterium]
MNIKPKILICDDDSEILQTLHLSLRSSFEIVTANNVSKAKKIVKDSVFDAAVIDLNFEGQEQDGIHLLDFMSKTSPGTFLIVLSGDTSTKRIIEATRRRLFEFIVKDANYFEQLSGSLKKATQLSVANREQAQTKYLTQSEAVKDVLRKVDTILRSNSEAPILILGETGTGKEFLAQHIALNLKVKAVTANMGCIPKEMAESILFGHERGAFTGAITSKAGLLETAHNGLFFLDEIGECSSSVQTKLLRVVQEKEVQALGSNKTKKINVRFIAATHRDLNKLVTDGTFRLDLLQRLNTFILKLPPLRERPEDIIFYANLFIEELSRDGARFHLTPDGEKELLAYPWQGNIRELRNVIERIVVLSPRMTIDKSAVAEAIEYGKPPHEVNITRAEIVENNARKEEVIKTLNEYNGNKRKAAVSLGISEATLYRWLKEFDLTKKLSAQSFRDNFEVLA